MRNVKIVKLKSDTTGKTDFLPEFPLEPFNFTEWATGIEFDLTSKAWGGKGGRVRDKTRTIKIKAEKITPVKKIREIPPAIGVLCDNEDNIGRTVADHRAMIEYYSAMYDSGKTLFTGEDINEVESLEYFQEVDGDLIERGSPVSVDEMKAVAKQRNDEPFRDTRNNTHSDADGYALLEKAFRAMNG